MALVTGAAGREGETMERDDDKAMYLLQCCDGEWDLVMQSDNNFGALLREAERLECFPETGELLYACHSWLSGWHVMRTESVSCWEAAAEATVVRQKSLYDLLWRLMTEQTVRIVG